jgi:hypothetical protein
VARGETEKAVVEEVEKEEEAVVGWVVVSEWQRRS